MNREATSSPSRALTRPAALAGTLIVACAATAATWWWHAPARDTAPVERAVQAPHRGAFIGSVAGKAAPATTSAPELADTQAPDGLHVDARGHLIVECANRLVFDYFLDVPASLPQPQRTALAEAHLRAKLAQPALDEARALLQRYLTYRKALAGQDDDRAKPTPEQLQQQPQMIAALRQQVGNRAALRRQYLGADVAQAWYGDEDAMDAASLERLAVAIDPMLSAEARAARIAAIDATLPLSVQQARHEAAAPAQLASNMQKMHNESLTEAQMRQRLAQQGTDSAVIDRLMQADKTEADWRTRYDAYARERDRIANFSGLSDADRAAQIAQLRQQTFPASNEVLRAQALDGLAQRK